MKRTIVLSSFALAFLGCSYAISPDLVKKVDKTVTFEHLLADPAAYQGKTVILGGTIVSAKNTKAGTLIEIFQKKLDYWGKPLRTDTTGGRFLALHRGPHDLMAYAPGRDIVVAGEVAGTDRKGLVENAADLPLIIVKELKLWEKPGPSWKQPQWWDPLYDPYGQTRQGL